MQDRNIIISNGKCTNEKHKSGQMGNCAGLVPID